MANESTPDAEVNREISEAAAAGARAVRTRSPEDIANAMKEGGEAVVAIAKSGWSWQKIVLAIGAAVVTLFVGAGSVAMVMRDANQPAAISTPVKADPDIVKMLTDEFAKLDKTMMGVGVEIKSLAKKLDDKPAPIPVDPDKPTPPKPGPSKALTIPDKVETTVGGRPVEVKAVSVGVVTWIVPPAKGLYVYAVNDAAILVPVADGEYWLGALTVVDGKATAPEWCRIVCGKGPQPPPGPTPPEPKPPVPPTPTDWPTTTPGLKVLIVFEEMERHKLASPYRALIDGAPIRTWMDEKKAEWRIFDQNQGVQGAEKHWQEMMGRKRTGVPWCVICNFPKSFYEGPLPASVDEFKAIIGKVE